MIVNVVPREPSQLGIEDETSQKLSDAGTVYFGSDLKNGIDFTYKEIFQDEAYRRHGITFEEGFTIFDVGANIGLFSLYASQRCNGKLSLYCFEPIPQTYYFLYKNLNSRGMLRNGTVKLFNVGLSHRDAPRQADFVHYKHASLLSTMKPAECETQIQQWEQLLNLRGFLQFFKVRSPKSFPIYWILLTPIFPFLRRYFRKTLDQVKSAQHVTCPLTTISEVCREQQVEVIDLLKIDAEGSEWDVLNGIDESDWPKIRQLAMEVNDVDGRVDAIERKLREQAFEHIIIERPEWSLESIHHIFFVFAQRKSL